MKQGRVLGRGRRPSRPGRAVTVSSRTRVLLLGLGLNFLGFKIFPAPTCRRPL